MLVNQIKEVIKGEVIENSNELKAYGHDASIFEVQPKLVVKPKDSDDIKNIVKFVSEHKSSDPSLSLTARAGGSDMSGGPLNESIILDFTAHMNKVIEVGVDYAITEPGAFYRDFEKETLKKGLLMPSYPASRELCAVGGMVANNAGGEKSLRYGKTENYVEELDVVLNDGNEYVFKALTVDELEQKKSQNDFEGEIYRKMHELLGGNYELIQKAKPDVSKNSAGYALWNIWRPAAEIDGDVESQGQERQVSMNGNIGTGMFDLTKLFVGSQGTLGIITKMKFRLVNPATFSKLLIVFLKDMDVTGDLVIALNTHNPESMESYDDNTFKLALKILPDLVRKIGLASLFKFIPDVWAIVTGGVPKLIMLVEFTGDDEESVERKVQNIKQEIKSRFKVKTRIASNEADVQKYWTIRRESFNLLRKHVKGKKAAPFIDDIIVKPEYLSKFLTELKGILDEYKKYMIYTIAGHPGDGNFHIIPLMDLSDEKSRLVIPEISEKVYDLVLKYGGSITAEHNDGLIRTPYLEKMYGEDIVELFEQVKEIFDPLNIFNPGKKVGGDIEYSMRHIKTNF
ncbi:MAG: hypothetical protein A2651_01100 [Candidatus Yanofskybacteria bacterium RIFCSPHIGHO2_01_FULL_42_12]|uniref:D-lactate dehydrogenase (cytochrome) n=1 Tax=Candidatus Yanofskybacteria bacterium RIFCSPLOWO2_01_FULL_42_49 TaxID=1802694 RepID=A0A1F8GB93_9BACT|nr:MAG: hypothetical protein A2651_01100 [Candidatus Yanofskybacteria bacterium RIFCSPHIGHO2_01_FULL_42_12]OGN22654.1 MAG: hypothetical protein A2918_00950 [Candidatus Yanofskybacteria bacterium RIFCSPLOWO2_01_FULL_42_49]